MASHAFPSHFTSRRNSSRFAEAKNFGAFCAGWQSGFSRPSVTRIGISCGENPKYHAACAAFNRAGSVLKFRNCSLSIFIGNILNAAGEPTLLPLALSSSKAASHRVAEIFGWSSSWSVCPLVGCEGFQIGRFRDFVGRLSVDSDILSEDFRTA